MLLAIATPLDKPETSEASTEPILGDSCGAAGRPVDFFLRFYPFCWPVNLERCNAGYKQLVSTGLVRLAAAVAPWKAASIRLKLDSK